MPLFSWFSIRTHVNFYRENFLQVEIFYKELTERKVSQQKAFEFQSLLSKQFIILNGSPKVDNQTIDLQLLYALVKYCLEINTF